MHDVFASPFICMVMEFDFVWHILSPEGHLSDTGREAYSTVAEGATSPSDLPMQKFPPVQEVPVC